MATNFALGVALLGISLLAAGCDDAANTADPSESEATVSDLDILLQGAPDNSKLPDEAKSDQLFDAKWTELASQQSAVKSQGGRGVCSIFSTVALMEHLYIKEGTLKDPDFSEQFLQWSSKVELGRFTKTGGSNASANIDTIHRFGIVLESDDPYESFKWGTSNDEACTGDDQPTRCHTNGDPSADAIAAKRWHLPNKRFISSKPENIKAYMVANKTAVVAGMQFFYQSWNHRRSDLPINSDYWSEGYVLYPNAEDKEKSGGDRRAGHSILIIGWDDNLEVPVVDAEGNEVTDEDGKVVTEKGFWLFKNSWGTGGFGIRNEAGAGYGWLSMKYVSEFATVNSAGVPELDLAESCGDGADNDYNGLTDCADPRCADDPTCVAPATEFDKEDPAEIPDNDPRGLTQTILVPTVGFVASVTVRADVQHTFPGDLEITLISPEGTESVLLASGAAFASEVPKVWRPANFVGESLAGEWSLRVKDLANKDVGTLNRWSLEFEITNDAPVEVCDDGRDNSGNGMIDCADPACSGASNCQTSDGPWQGANNTSVAIPDNDIDGAVSTVDIDGTGHVGSVNCLVEITHTWVGDLTLTLIHPDGTEALLQRQDGGDADAIKKSFTVDDFTGKPVSGQWSLKVVDSFDGDSGTIDSFLLDISAL